MAFVTRPRKIFSRALRIVLLHPDAETVNARGMQARTCSHAPMTVLHSAGTDGSRMAKSAKAVPIVLSPNSLPVPIANACYGNSRTTAEIMSWIRESSARTPLPVPAVNCVRVASASLLHAEMASLLLRKSATGAVRAVQHGRPRIPAGRIARAAPFAGMESWKRTKYASPITPALLAPTGWSVHRIVVPATLRPAGMESFLSASNVMKVRV